MTKKKSESPTGVKLMASQIIIIIVIIVYSQLNYYYYYLGGHGVLDMSVGTLFTEL